MHQDTFGSTCLTGFFPPPEKNPLNIHAFLKETWFLAKPKLVSRQNWSAAPLIPTGFASHLVSANRHCQTQIIPPRKWLTTWDIANSLIFLFFLFFFLETCIFKYSVDFVLWKSFYRFWSHLSKAEKCPCFSKQIMIFSFGTHLTIVFGMNKNHIFLFTFYSTHWKYNKIILRWNILRKFWEKNIIKEM